MKRGSVALGSSILKEFLSSIDNTFDVLKDLTGVDFLDQNKKIESDFEGKYFGDWLYQYGAEIIKQLETVKIDGWKNDDLLDCLDYNVFALSKAVATKDADIIYATVADCLADVKKAVEQVEQIVISYDGEYAMEAVDELDLHETYEVIAFSAEDTFSSEKAFSYAIAC